MYAIMSDGGFYCVEISHIKLIFRNIYGSSNYRDSPLEAFHQKI